MFVKAFDVNWQKITVVTIIIMGIIGFVFNFSFLNRLTLWKATSVLIFSILFITKNNKPYIRFVVFCCVFIYSTALSGFAYKTVGENNAYERWYISSTYCNSNLGDLEDAVLYLDGGIGAFIFNNKSFLRYSYPLPIQRIDEANSDFINRKAFMETKDNILSYNNKYITLDDKWFFKYPHMDIKKKLDAEYHMVDTITYVSFSFDLFSPVEVQQLYLLKRN